MPGNTTLLKLHDILQIVMGWQDYHLHMFRIEGTIYGDPADDEYGDLGTLDEADYKLNQMVPDEGQRFTYEYDFGDSWNHTLRVEKILPAEEGARRPVCLKGKRACPPEDVGGPPGYENILEAIRNSGHTYHDEYLAWIGGEFDPEAFDLEEINNALHSMGRGRSAEAMDAWHIDEGEPEGHRFNLNFPWAQSLPPDQQAVAENLPLRSDTITLISYLRDNKVTGTQSTGNLPLKAVREICARFANPPTLDDVIGEHVFRLRSESHVWQLYFPHVLASVAGLISGGVGRRWKLTPLGDLFLAAPAPIQVWLLCITWWTQINWAIAFPFGFEDGYMPYGLRELTLEHLLNLTVDDPVAFELFADRMIADAGLVRPIEDQDSARIILRGVIERMVIDPLVDFGILQPEYQPHKVLGEDYRDLKAFWITSFGEGLLDAVRRAMGKEAR